MKKYIKNFAWLQFFLLIIFIKINIYSQFANGAFSFEIFWLTILTFLFTHFYLNIKLMVEIKKNVEGFNNVRTEWILLFIGIFLPIINWFFWLFIWIKNKNISENKIFKNVDMENNSTNDIIRARKLFKISLILLIFIIIFTTITQILIEISNIKAWDNSIIYILNSIHVSIVVISSVTLLTFLIKFNNQAKKVFDSSYRINLIIALVLSWVSPLILIYVFINLKKSYVGTSINLSKIEPSIQIQ